MTKVYLVKEGRVNKQGTVYNVVNEVFTNYKLAEKYQNWLTKSLTEKNKWYQKHGFEFQTIRYYVETWPINKMDYSKIPF